MGARPKKPPAGAVDWTTGVPCVCTQYTDGASEKDAAKTGLCQRKLPEYDGRGGNSPLHTASKSASSSSAAAGNHLSRAVGKVSNNSQAEAAAAAGGAAVLPVVAPLLLFASSAVAIPVWSPSRRAYRSLSSGGGGRPLSTYTSFPPGLAHSLTRRRRRRRRRRRPSRLGRLIAQEKIRRRHSRLSLFLRRLWTATLSL